MGTRAPIGIAAAVAALLAAAPAEPCAPAPPAGRRVDVLAEQAVIVWDPQQRVEHFIRRASFDADVPDFGFLVPTPSPPQLAEATDMVFDSLHAAIQPEVVERKRWRLQPVLIMTYWLSRTSEAPMTAGAPQGAVRVLEETRVAGYDAAVLQADDAAALLAWLRERGYASRPELQEWLQPYVEKRWAVTAFKVAGARDGRVATQAVRMSFATDRPFFPYREPADQRHSTQAARELRVYLVTPGRMEGAIGAGGTWPAEVLYAAPRPDISALLVHAAPSPASSGSAAWLTAFKDSSNPRPATDDLFFSASASAAPVVPPPVEVEVVERVPVPLEPAAFLIGAALWLRRRVLRRHGEG